MPIILNSESLESVEESIPGWAVVIFILVLLAMVLPLIIMVWGLVYEEYLKDIILKLKKWRKDEEASND